MNNNIRKLWRALRHTFKDSFTFNEMKEVVAAATLPVEDLSRLKQKSLPAKGASKGELVDAIDELIELAPDPNEAIQKLIDAMLDQNPRIQRAVCECAARFGWTIVGGQLRHSEFQVEDAVSDLSEDVKGLLKNAYQRFREGDYSGAMTAVCSALDNVTNHIYREYDLGEPRNDSYQQRVTRSFGRLEDLYRAGFSQVTADTTKVDLLWQNYKGAINQAAYVMGAFRRNASDVHGVTQCPPEVVRHAIDCGTFIIRSMTIELSGNEPEGNAFEF